MGIKTKVPRGLRLTKASWQVMREDKELIALPVMSAVTSLIFLVLFLAVPVVQIGTSQAVDFKLILSYIALFLSYLGLAFITIFFLSALILFANERMTGGNPTLKSALRDAWKNARHILPWAIITATVSIVLNLISARAGFIGKAVVALIGVAWTIVTLLVLPILVIEGVGVKEAFTRSGGALKRTWGEELTGLGGIGIIQFLAMFAGILLFGGMIYIGISTELYPVAWFGGILMVIWLLVVGLFCSALSGVFRTALYRYAMFGETSAGFSQDLLENAFKQKKPGTSSAI